MLRTDLAAEAKTLFERDAAQTTKLEGVRATTRGEGETEITQVEILDERGAKALQKPVGTYLTMELPRFDRDARRPAKVLARELTKLLQLQERDSVLVIGLGNPAVTPDALGPQTVERLFLTRHLIASLPAHFGMCRAVSAVTPGVLATTGIESLELVRGAVAHVRPRCVIAVDALAAGSLERLCSTVQLSDSGIVPGSGVGNSRAGFNRESLGVPVFALGVPTVADAASLIANAHEQMIVTPRDIDAQLRFLSAVLATGLNRALHSSLSDEEFCQFAPFYS